MNHAEHFLSRLDRLATREVDFALNLYRDTPLVRAVIDAAGVPDGAERVALSIDDPQQGPFLVLTRDGRFVTCLGRGMIANGLPVIPRAKLDSVASKINVLRERMALAERDEGKRGHKPSDRILKKLVTNAHALTREDFLEAARWEPLLQNVYLDLYIWFCLELLRYAPRIVSARPGKPKADAAIMAFGNMLHAVSHLFLLATMSGRREVFEERLGKAPLLRTTLSRALTMSGMIPFIARGAWGIGRLGKPMLASQKQMLDDAILPYLWFDAVFGLVALGRRTPALRAEVQKALRAAPAVGTSTASVLMRHDNQALFQQTVDMAIAGLALSDDESEARLVALGQEIVQMSVPTLGEPPPVMLTDPRMFPVMLPIPGYVRAEGVSWTLTVIQGTARGGPELFYRSAAQEHLVMQWDLKTVDKMLKPLRALLARRVQPLRRPDRPGPNDPCLCLSGIKYKRCCRDRERETIREWLEPTTPHSPDSARAELQKIRDDEATLAELEADLKGELGRQVIEALKDNDGPEARRTRQAIMALREAGA